jgi:hypothetical protein
MNARAAGQRGGRRKSPAKRVAAQRNGALGGRPKKVEMLLRNMRAVYAKIKDQGLNIDPGDLGLIVERMCRPPGSGRRFFIRPLVGGGYGF